MIRAPSLFLIRRIQPARRPRSQKRSLPVKFPCFNSLSDELVKAEGKGAIAAFFPTGLSLNEPAYLYHKALLSELTSAEHLRLGDAVLAVQGVYADSGSFPEFLSIGHLFGAVNHRKLHMKWHLEKDEQVIPEDS